MAKHKKSTEPKDKVRVKSVSTNTEKRAVGYGSLAYAVVVQAVSDYCNCTERILHERYNANGEFTKTSCTSIFVSTVQFFLSGESDIFLDIEGKALLDGLNRKLSNDLGVEINELPIHRYLH